MTHGDRSGFADKALGWLSLALTRRRTDGSCPDAETLVAWQDGALSGAESSRVKHHVAHCDDCSRAWFALLDFDGSAPAAAVTPATVVRRRWFAPPQWLGLAAGVAIAGLALVLVNPFQAPDATLPAYDLLAEGGAGMRGGTDPAPTEPIALRPGETLRLILTPADPVDADLDVQLWRLDEDRATQVAVPALTISPSGSVRIEGRLGESIVLPPGEQRLLIVLGQRDHMPRVRRVERVLGDGAVASDDAWVAWTVDVLVEP